MSCNRCGKCCSNILMLSQKEISKIKKYMVDNDIEVINHNTILSKEDSKVCPFLNNDKLCNIYPVRPSICRSFNCDKKIAQTMDYDGVKAINMLLTFGGENMFTVSPPDLSMINERIKNLQTKIKKGKK